MSDAQPPRARRRPPEHVLARVVTGTVVLLVGLVMVFAWRVVYRPHLDPMPDEPVDVLLVLGPLEDWRVEMANQLMAEGRARNLVLSTPDPALDQRHCGAADWPVICFEPEPSTTRGEAMQLKRLMAENGWTTAAVLTVDFHAARSRFIFERCLGQPVPVVGRHVSYWDDERPYMVAYQLGGYLKEIRLGRCEA